MGKDSNTNDQDTLDELSFRPDDNNNNNNNSINTTKQSNTKKSKRKKKSRNGVGTAAPPPTIRYDNDDATDLYGEDVSTTNNETSLLLPPVPLGDSTLRPNIGKANKSLDYNICSPETKDLPTVVFRMRCLNMTLCGVAISLQTTAFFTQLLHPSKIVLGAYLVLFASILCGYELHNPSLSSILADNFGFLQEPFGRAFFLLLMSTLAASQNSILLYVLGGVLFVNSIYSVYLPCRYPQFQNVYRANATTDAVQVVQEEVRGYAWANPSSYLHYSNGL
uniref:Uncharacterized protein n=1 Tax=Ditylum brightwellii TaxID=49249 RepID=A0A7S4WDB5_9STRA